MTIIMGIDPGTKVTGYGIIKIKDNVYKILTSGYIKPSYKLDLNLRYLKIYLQLEKLIKDYSPDAVSIETQFLKENIQIAIKLGMARGIAIIAALKNKVPVYEYAPRQAKLAVVGNGNASKEQVQKMIGILFNTDKKITKDEADALSLAICHAHKKNFEINYV